MQYKLRRVWWDERKEAKEAYSDKVVAYVNRLNVDEDIAFLKRCGWEVPREISVPYKIFTFFVKMGVQLNLTAAHMVVIAQNNHKTQAFNLLNMLGDQTLEDDVFVQKSHEKIEDRLRQYSERFLWAWTTRKVHVSDFSWDFISFFTLKKKKQSVVVLICLSK